MTINEIFKSVNESIKETDLIRLSTLTDEEIKSLKSQNIPIPYHFELKEMSEYLEKDIEDFYYNTKNFCMLCYYKGSVLIDIYNYSIDQLKTFNIKETIEARLNFEKNCLENGKFESLFALIDKRISFMIYKNLFDIIPDKHKYQIFKDIYVRNEYGFSSLDNKMTEKIFSTKKKNTRSSLSKVIKGFDKDGNLVIYRGCGTLSTPSENAYSWTTDINVALKFASRFDSIGTVYKGTIFIDDIVDYINTREEKEIITNLGKVKNIEKLDLLNFESIYTELDNNSVFKVYQNYASKISPLHFKYPTSIHGMKHAKRVLLLNLIMSHYLDLNDEDKIILNKASIYHDIGRTNDNVCLTHGFLSTKKMLELKIIKNFNSEQNQILKYVIENHCIKDEDAFENFSQYNIKNKTRAINLLKIFKDADNLDRVRIKDLDLSYLRNNIAKNLLLVAYQLLRGIE